MRDIPPTADETRFYEALLKVIPDMHDWYHQDDDGGLWMIASFDVIQDDRWIAVTWRCDYDGHSIAAGRSPAGLNWDDGVRARDAKITVLPPGGMQANVTSPEEAAELILPWFLERISYSRDLLDRGLHP